MMLKTLALLSCSLPLFSLSSSRNTQLLALADTYRVSATGGLHFDVREAAHARYTTETYQGVPGTRGYARNGQPVSRLQIHLIAPGNRWKTLHISVTNYNSRWVADKLYLWTYIDYRGGEPLREENVDCRIFWDYRRVMVIREDWMGDLYQKVAQTWVALQTRAEATAAPDRRAADRPDRRSGPAGEALSSNVSSEVLPYHNLLSFAGISFQKC